MSSVQLDDEEWQRVVAIIATAPWTQANPLLMKISAQLRQQQLAGAVLKAGNSGEMPDLQAQVGDKQAH